MGEVRDPGGRAGEEVVREWGSKERLDGWSGGLRLLGGSRRVHGVVLSLVLRPVVVHAVIVVFLILRLLLRSSFPPGTKADLLNRPNTREQRPQLRLGRVRRQVRDKQRPLPALLLIASLLRDAGRSSGVRPDIEVVDGGLLLARNNGRVGNWEDGERGDMEGGGLVLGRRRRGRRGSGLGGGRSLHLGHDHWLTNASGLDVEAEGWRLGDTSMSKAGSEKPCESSFAHGSS